MARLKLAAAELRADLLDLAAIEGRLRTFSARLDDDRHDSALSSALALWLDHYYTACEATLGRLLAALDGVVPAGDDWHARLLRAASVALSGIRPALISSAARAELDELRGFRHKLRHTYLLELDAERVGALAASALRLHVTLLEDLEAIASWLDELADE